MSDFVNTVDVVGDVALTDSIINRSITKIVDDSATSIGPRAFSNCSALVTATFRSATSIGKSAFQSCGKLTSVNIPAVKNVDSDAFYYCFELSIVDFSSAERLNSRAVGFCEKLKAVILRKTDAICYLTSNAFYYSSITSGTGYIYVPAALKGQYEQEYSAQSFANQFRALEDYTVDGTTTGALDQTKI